MASLPDTNRNPEVDPLRLRRTCSLTVFGLEQFQQKVTSFVSRLARLKRSIDSILTYIDINPISDLGTASDIRADLSQLSNKYEALSKEYISFLLRNQSEESTRLLQEHNLVSRPLRAGISGTLQKLTLIRKPKNGKSLSSAGSDMTSIAQGSRSSAHLTTVIAQHAARAEAARVKLKYAKEESAISELLATMQARKRTLQLERDYDVAECKLAAIKQAMSFSNLESPNAVFNQNFDYYADDSDNNSDTGQPVSSIKEYVKQVSANRYDDLPSKSYNSHHSSVHVQNDDPAGSLQDKSLDHCVHANNIMYDMSNNRDDSQPTQDLDPKAPVFVPKTDSTGNIQSRELAKFLVKKDLLTSRLVSFDDNPTHYPYWKVSFKNMIDELDALPLEHLDLLIKSLGPSSKKQAVNILSANGHDLKSAIKFTWERLDDRYGSPEMIESALKKRIQKFPRLTESNREELFELSDLVAEIESVKSDAKFSTLFAYFDSSTGVNLIVEKLPFRIQEKWTNEANTYKRSHQVIYPPFSFFSSFLHRIARIRNDPGFIYERPTYQRNNQDKQSQGRGQNVSVRKTEVVQKENKGVLCPIHNTGHSLNMCRAFRNQPLADRQKFVKEKGFCFTCRQTL